MVMCDVKKVRKVISVLNIFTLSGKHNMHIHIYLHIHLFSGMEIFQTTKSPAPSLSNQS